MDFFLDRFFFFLRRSSSDELLLLLLEELLDDEEEEVEGDLRRLFFLLFDRRDDDRCLLLDFLCLSSFLCFLSSSISLLLPLLRPPLPPLSRLRLRDLDRDDMALILLYLDGCLVIVLPVSEGDCICKT